MKPIGPLMREHRLIERMVKFLERKLPDPNTLEPAGLDVLWDAVDFFRTYADRTHHGKEEDILFRDLSGKTLSAEHTKIMYELVAEHVYARKTVGGLAVSLERFRQGENAALEDIKELLRKLTVLYPAHIEKEDKHFFYPVMEYFSKEEQDVMLQEFWEFDRSMIHEKYRKVVERLEE